MFANAMPDCSIRICRIPKKGCEISSQPLESTICSILVNNRFVNCTLANCTLANRTLQFTVTSG